MLQTPTIHSIRIPHNCVRLLGLNSPSLAWGGPSSPFPIQIIAGLWKHPSPFVISPFIQMSANGGTCLHGYSSYQPLGIFKPAPYGENAHMGHLL